MKLFSYVWHDVFRRPYKLFKRIDIGSGKTVLLIHGIAVTASTWQPLVDQIDKTKWHVIGFDLLGFGNSPKPTNATYDVTEHADAIVASLDKKLFKKKIIIIGHSMGCLIASHIATQHPKLVKHLILYEPPLFADSPEFRSHSRRKKLYFALYKEVLSRPNMVYNYSKIAARFASERALSVNKSTWFAFERSMKNTIMRQKAYTDLKHISVPTDIIYGKYDFLVTRASVKKMLESNTYVTFHLVSEMHDINNRASKYIIKLLKPLY